MTLPPVRALGKTRERGKKEGKEEEEGNRRRRRMMMGEESRRSKKTKGPFLEDREIESRVAPPRSSF